MLILLNITFGTASLAAFIYVLWELLSHRNGGKRRAGLGILFLFLLLTIGTWWLARTSPVLAVDSQSDTIVVSGRDDEAIEVFYLRKYAYPPSLKISFKSGWGNFQLLEQRADGFKLKMGGFGHFGEAVILWEAKGTTTIQE